MNRGANASVGPGTPRMERKTLGLLRSRPDPVRTGPIEGPEPTAAFARQPAAAHCTRWAGRAATEQASLWVEPVVIRPSGPACAPTRRRET